MKNIHQLPILFFFLFLASISCSKKSSTSEPLIPELITRSESIQYGKEWDETMNNYQKYKIAIEKDINDNESILRLAALFIKEARVTGEHGHYYPAALKMTDLILSNKAVDQQFKFLALSTKAGVQLSLHDFSSALETGKVALAINNRSAQIYGVLVDANVELGNYTEAVALADIMIQIKPDLRSYARISYLREIHGQIDASIEAMKMAVASGVPGHDDTAWAMHTLGGLYERYGKVEEAKNINLEILAMRPNYPFAVGSLGELAFQAGNLDEAMKYTNEAIGIIPEVGFYTQKAKILQKLGKTSEFDDIMKEVWVMLQDDEKSGHNMNLEYASIYLEILNQSDKALTYAQAEYEKRPSNIDVNRIIAKIYKAKGDEVNAAKYKTAASVTNSKHPELASL